MVLREKLYGGQFNMKANMVQMLFGYQEHCGIRIITVRSIRKTQYTVQGYYGTKRQFCLKIKFFLG